MNEMKRARKGIIYAAWKLKTAALRCKEYPKGPKGKGNELGAVKNKERRNEKVSKLQ